MSVNPGGIEQPRVRGVLAVGAVHLAIIENTENGRIEIHSISREVFDFLKRIGVEECPILL